MYNNFFEGLKDVQEMDDQDLLHDTEQLDLDLAQRLTRKERKMIRKLEREQFHSDSSEQIPQRQASLVDARDEEGYSSISMNTTLKDMAKFKGGNSVMSYDKKGSFEKKSIYERRFIKEVGGKKAHSQVSSDQNLTLSLRSDDISEIHAPKNIDGSNSFIQPNKYFDCKMSGCNKSYINQEALVQHQSKTHLKHLENMMGNSDFEERDEKARESMRSRSVQPKSKRSSKKSRKSKSQVYQNSDDNKLDQSSQSAKSQMKSKRGADISKAQLKKDKKKFRDDIEYLDEKLKPKYAAQLKLLNEQTQNLEKKVEKIKCKVDDEIENANKVNLEIEKENERYRRLQELQRRYVMNDKLIDKQQNLNYELFAHFNDITNKKKQEYKNKAEAHIMQVLASNASQVTYKPNKDLLMTLQNIEEMQQGQTIELVNNDAYIRSGLSKADDSLQAIVIKFIFARELYFDTVKSIIQTKVDPVAKNDLKQFLTKPHQHSLITTVRLEDAKNEFKQRGYKNLWIRNIAKSLGVRSRQAKLISVEESQPYPIIGSELQGIENEQNVKKVNTQVVVYEIEISQEETVDEIRYKQNICLQSNNQAKALNTSGHKIIHLETTTQGEPKATQVVQNRDYISQPDKRERDFNKLTKRFRSAGNLDQQEDLEEILPFTQQEQKCTLIQSCNSGKCEFTFGAKMIQVIKNVRRLRFNMRFFKYIWEMSLFQQKNNLMPKECQKRPTPMVNELGENLVPEQLDYGCLRHRKFVGYYPTEKEYKDVLKQNVEKAKTDHAKKEAESILKAYKEKRDKLNKINKNQKIRKYEYREDKEAKKCEEDTLLLKEIRAFLDVFEKSKLSSLDRCSLNDFANQSDQLIFKIHKMGFLALKDFSLESIISRWKNMGMAELALKKKEQANEDAKLLIDQILDDQIEYMDPLDRKRMMSVEPEVFKCECDCDYRCEVRDTKDPQKIIRKKCNDKCQKNRCTNQKACFERQIFDQQALIKRIQDDKDNKFTFKWQQNFEENKQEAILKVTKGVLELLISSENSDIKFKKDKEQKEQAILLEIDVNLILSKIQQPEGVDNSVNQIKKQRQTGQASRSQESLQADRLEINEFDVEYVDQCSFFITVKLYGQADKSVPTNFAEIKRAAIDYWGLKECEKYFIVTDEYFNNLSAYRDTVANFFSQDTDEQKYQPLNSNGHACVFFLCKSIKKENIHALQVKTSSLQAPGENKDDVDDEEGIFKRIKLEKIAETIVGLKTYEGVKKSEMEKKMIAYTAWTESHKDPTISIWTFIMACVLMGLNIYGKNIKNSYLEEYGIRKVVESFFMMNLFREELDQDQYIQNEDFIQEMFENDSKIDMDLRNITQELEHASPLTIKSKLELQSYFKTSFNKIFNTPGQFLQETYKIVGPIRLRTIHTEVTECRKDTEIQFCYERPSHDHHINKETIDGIDFQTCKELNINKAHVINGENLQFGCYGHALDIFIDQVDNSTQFIDILDDHQEMLFGQTATGLDIMVTLYMPRADWWIMCEVFYEYGVQGQQILSSPFSNFQTFKLNTYQTEKQIKELTSRNIVVDEIGVRLLRFDVCKLVLYSIYFGKQQFDDIKFVLTYPNRIQERMFMLIWNGTISVLNITNFVFFQRLSKQYDTNTLLRENVYIDSVSLAKLYWWAQLFDSILVYMNMFMIIKFTRISRQISYLSKIIAMTAVYLFYLILTYFLALAMMSVIVWQVWGDTLSYFRNPQLAMMYTTALFDLKTMYLATDFMDANQMRLDEYWLFIMIIIFAVVLHYTITLQYSAYFHIYFNISKKYEEQLQPGEKYAYLEKSTVEVYKEWLMGLTKNPFLPDVPPELDEDGNPIDNNTMSLLNPTANLKNIGGGLGNIGGAVGGGLKDIGGGLGKAIKIPS